MCFVFILQQTPTFALYNINWFVFLTEMKSVYCAVRTESLDETVSALSLKGQPLRLADTQYVYCQAATVLLYII
jgi:hypothetical protein